MLDLRRLCCGTSCRELVAPRDHPGVAVRSVAEGPVDRTIFAATRIADAKRPSVEVLLAAVGAAAADLGWLPPSPAA